VARAISDTIGLRICALTCGLVILTAMLMGVTILGMRAYAMAQESAALPQTTLAELSYLEANDLGDSPRAYHLQRQHLADTAYFNVKFAVIIALAVCLPVGLGASIGVARYVGSPLAAIAQAARRISRADLSVRAELGHSGGLTPVLKDFNAMADSLESLERDRKLTAAAISHELRTPLAVLTASLHALADGIIPAGPDVYRRMVAQTTHLNRLIDDLHTLSIADAGKLDLNHAVTDLGDLASDVLLQFDQRLANAGVVGSVTRSGGATRVWADSGRMRQVLGNLIENVVRYAAEGGKLDIHVERSAHQVHLTIRDFGAGLPSSMQNHLFERFYRPDMSRARTTGGSGLGLAIVKALVEAQGGTVQVSSARGAGCVFVIAMPALAEA